MIAALAVITNLGQTLSGDWENARRNVVIRYLMVGATAYTLVTILTGISGFRSVAAVLGLTTWHEGLMIGSTLVAIPALGVAFIFHAFPRTTGRDLASEETAERGLRLLTWGGGITAAAFLIAGLVSGITWNWANASGSRLNAGTGFSDTLADVDVMFTVGALASVVALVGLLANAVLGWWWADPVAALGVAALIAIEGRQVWKIGASCCEITDLSFQSNCRPLRDWSCATACC